MDNFSFCATPEIPRFVMKGQTPPTYLTWEVTNRQEWIAQHSQQAQSTESCCW